MGFKVIELTSSQRHLCETNKGLTSYLGGLVRGRDATPHSWLYEGESSRDTLLRWWKILLSVNDSSEFKTAFNQVEKAQLSKFGPQGKVPPMWSPETLEVLEPLYEDSPFNDELALQEFFPEAKKLAEEMFGALKTERPLSFERVIDDMRERDTDTTNSGFPRFTRRKNVRNEEIADAASLKAFEYPAILLFRQYNGKLRPVWMYPMSLNLFGMRYQQQIQERMRTSPAKWVREYLSPWAGYEDVKRVLTHQWEIGKTIAGGDTTKMDANMRPAQIRLVFEVVKWLFQERYWDELYRSMKTVNTIDLIVGPDRALSGVHGLASGSEWTQITETILQLLMAKIKGCVGQGIGDDFIWFTDITDTELVKYLARFGLPANPSKQEISRDQTKFLQRVNHLGFFSREDRSVLGGYYPTVRALNSSLNPEKYHRPDQWNSDMFCVRQYMILENCVDDPAFDEFVKFVVNGQKDLIPFAKRASGIINASQQRARLIPGLNPSYNQEKREKPMSEFASIKLAKQL